MIENIFGLIIECVKLIIVLCGILNYKLKKSTLGGIVFLISCSLFEIFILCNWEYYINIVFFTAVFICLCFIEKRKKVAAFFIAAASFIIICSLDDLLLIIIVLCGIPNEVIIENDVYELLINCVSIFLLTIISVIVQRIHYKRKSSSNNQLVNSNLLLVILFTVGIVSSSIILTASSLYNINYTIENRLKIGICIGLFIIVFIVVGVLLIYNNNSKRYYKQIAEINNRLLEAQQNYYRMLQEKEVETRKFRHDINNHILCLSALIREEEYNSAKKYLEQMRDAVDELKPKYQTGNMLLNVIVNDISQKYENVRMEWTGNVPNELTLSSMDLCTIFSNVLENSFLAASKCSPCGYVNVVAKIFNNSLFFNITNNICEEIKEEKGNFLSQKDDKKNHGFGTQNIKTCVAANGGSVEFSYTKDSFTVEIILPNVIK